MLSRRAGADTMATTATTKAAGAAVAPNASTVAGWLQPQDLLLEVDAQDRRAVLRVAADRYAVRRGLAAERIFDALWRREQAGSTALGAGFAIPHARIGGIDRPATLYLRTRVPIEFGAADGVRVSHCLVILVPADGADADHLALLASVARLFADRRFRVALARAERAELVAAAFTNGIARTGPGR